MRFGGLVHHLIHGQREEVAEHDVDDRAQAGHGRADADSGEAGFGDRRVEHALGAEFFHEAGEHFEWRSRFGDVFAENADARVAAHLFGEGLAHRLRKCEFARSGIDILVDLIDAGIRRGDRELHGSFHLGACFG